MAGCRPPRRPLATDPGAAIGAAVARAIGPRRADPVSFACPDPECGGATFVQMTRQAPFDGGTLRWRCCSACGQQFYSLQDPERAIPRWTVTWPNRGVPSIDHVALAKLEAQR
jgi:hypothetical protein